MKNIKFRVWNTKEKKMITQDDNTRLDLILEYYELNKHVTEPMQWIGLLDKNGKEIYGGDIIVAPYTRLPSDGYKRKEFPDEIYKAHKVEYSERTPEYIFIELFVLDEYKEFDLKFNYRLCPDWSCFPKRMFWVEKDGKMANSWHYDRIKHIEGDKKYLVIPDAEIIGNIYENPELVKKGKNNLC